jgi:hypothetical protein
MADVPLVVQLSKSSILLSTSSFTYYMTSLTQTFSASKLPGTEGTQMAYLIKLQNKKCIGFKSVDHGRHEIGPKEPISLSR